MSILKFGNQGLLTYIDPGMPAQSRVTLMKKWTEYTFILRPSSLGGIGVFATHDIPEGERVFSGKTIPRKMRFAEIPEAFRKYCIYLNDDECLCPERFDRMEIGWYLNHSHHPNIMKHPDNYMVTLRVIKENEEILIDYNHLDEPEHLKEDYYRK